MNILTFHKNAIKRQQKNIRRKKQQDSYCMYDNDKFITGTKTNKCKWTGGFQLPKIMSC